MLVKNYFEFLNIKDDTRILDVGCGPGDIAAEIFIPKLNIPPNYYIGVDISENNIANAKKKNEGNPNMAFHQMDFNHLNAEILKPVQTVISSNALHWVETPR